MGLFDYYEPDPPIDCPKCGAVLKGWQGKDRLPALLVWRQGVASPIDQRVDAEVRASPENMAKFRVSPQFWIYGGVCDCGYAFDDSRYGVHCTATDGVWTDWKIDPPPTPARDAGDNHLQCAECCDVWERVPGRRLYLCPGCGRLTSTG